MKREIDDYVGYVKDVFAFYEESIDRHSSWKDIVAVYQFDYEKIERLSNSAYRTACFSSHGINGACWAALRSRPYAADLIEVWRDNLIWPKGGNWLTVMPNGDKIFVDAYPKPEQITEKRQMLLFDVTIVTSLPVCYKGEVFPFEVGYNQKVRAINIHYEDELPKQCQTWLL